ncbi:MAG: hypothetical protein CSA05_03290 [Bacteroidia bacterium]|nr:MAG: hypothetical protein CSA05_03290 [Bacteroidia bacterium]
MKQINKKYLLLLSVLFVCIFSAAFFLIKPVKVGSVQSIQIKKISFSSLEMEVFLPIENPNFFAFDIHAADLDLTINDVRLGKLTSIDTVEIPARSHEIKMFKCKVKMGNVLVGFVSLLKSFQDDYVTVEIDGTVSVKSFAISKEIKVKRKKSSIKLPTL